jgi:hypothetical protein
MGIRLCLALVAGLTVAALLVPVTQGATAPQQSAAGRVPSTLGSPDPRDTAALGAVPAAYSAKLNPAGLVPSTLGSPDPRDTALGGVFPV